MRSLARWGTLPLLGLPLSSWALGLNDIETNSYLNQPLNAEIGLTATADELATLSITLAPADEFLAAGLDYPAFLTTLEFRVTRNAAGQNVIRVTSTESIAEPFVTLLIRATHARGSMTREYSVLLDPPLFLPEQAAADPIAPPVTRAPSTSVAGGDIARAPVPPPQTAPSQQPAPSRQPAAAPSAPAPAIERPPERAAATGAQDYTVVGGDTLWGITSRVRPAGVSINQAMMAIFEANPGAFQGNINRLRRGAILRIPPSAELTTMTTAAATAEVQRQIDAWRGNAGAAPTLTLLPPSDGAAAGVANDGSAARVGELEDQVAGLEAELASTSAELDDARRLLEIQSEELAELQTQLEAQGDAPPITEAEPEVATDEPEPLFADETPAETGADAEPAAEPEPAVNTTRAVVTQPSSPSLVDRILGWVTSPMFAIGAGVIVALLAVLAFIRRRRAADDAAEWEAFADDETQVDPAVTTQLPARPASEILVVEGSDDDAAEAIRGRTVEIEALDAGAADIDALEDDDAQAPSPFDDESGFAEQTLSSQTVINLDQADPIAEADFHMAYGLYDQAADLIAGALEADPGDRQLKLKLLEVYFVWGNKSQFLKQAKSLQADMGGATDADWDKVVIMGKQICPEESLFADATAAAGTVDLDLESSASADGLDFALEEESDDVDLDLSIGDSDDFSFEASDVQPIGRELDSATIAGDDLLAIGEATQAGLEAALFEEFEEQAEQTRPGARIDEFDAAAEAASRGDASPDLDSPTIESPTLETVALDVPTVETPAISLEDPEDAEPGFELEATAAPGMSGLTAELDIDDLDLDVGELEDLPDDIADLPDTSESLSLVIGGGLGRGRPDEELLSASGVTQVLDDEPSDSGKSTMMTPAFDVTATDMTTEVLEQPAANFDPTPPQTEDDLDLNLEDFSSALDGGDTIEQPMASRFGGLDLDVGADFGNDDEPTGAADLSPIDPQTMTEVGTKLDLARAYIDMGDPDGAKSILEEVLSEGDAGQRSEAEALMSALSA